MKKSTEKLNKKDILEGVTKDDPEQSRRFVETAKEIETENCDKLFKKAIEGIASQCSKNTGQSP